MSVDSTERLLVTLAALVVVLLISTLSSRRVIRAVERIGECYSELYKNQHREVMDALQSETRKALSDTKALVMEHTELERILRALAQRGDDVAAADTSLRAEVQDLREELRSHDVEPDK